MLFALDFIDSPLLMPAIDKRWVLLIITSDCNSAAHARQGREGWIDEQTKSVCIQDQVHVVQTTDFNGLGCADCTKIGARKLHDACGSAVLATSPQLGVYGSTRG